MNFEIRWRAASAPQLTSPWWLVSHDVSGRPVFAGAVQAASPEAALAIVQAAHVEPVVALDLCEARPADWSPYGPRRPRKEWMQW